MEKRIIDNVLLVIGGPTAAGKTALAVDIAEKLGSEILSADSRQIFKELRIGTARPSAEELNQVKHHFIASHSIFDSYNAGKFEIEALDKLDTLFRNNPVQVLAGGSGLYIDALTKGFDTFPEIDDGLRLSINELMDKKGLDHLRELLREKDPVYYEIADLQNPQRIKRALEVCLSSGKPYSSFAVKKTFARPFKILKFCVYPPKDMLYKAIDQRVDKMMDAGLLEEANAWLAHRNLNALRTVGYTELHDYLEEKMTLDQAVKLIKQHTRNFAKRQLTWFRRDKDYLWIQPQDTRVILEKLKALKLVI